MSSRRAKDLNWMASQLKDKYQIKTQRIRNPDGETEAKLLNRIVRVTTK